MNVYREFDSALDYEDGIYTYSERGRVRFAGDYRTVLAKLQMRRSEAQSNTQIKPTYRLYTDPMGEERKRREAREEVCMIDRFIRDLNRHYQRGGKR